MTFEQLKYLVEVARAGSITGAAEVIHVSIPGISQAISNLESEMGFKIFERTRSGIIPTPKGKKIVDEAYQIVASVENLKATAATIKTYADEILKIEASPNMFNLTFNTLNTLMKDHPHIKFSFEQKTAPEIIKNVQQNRVDVGITIFDQNIYDNSKIECCVLLEAKRCVCVSKRNVLSRHATVEPMDVIDQNLAVYTGHNMKIFLDKFFKYYGKMNILFETNSIEVIKLVVGNNNAISFTTDLLLKNDRFLINSDIITLPLVNYFEALPINFGWLRLKDKPPKSSVSIFLKYLSKECEYLNM